jgi:hypothetical protein
LRLAVWFDHRAAHFDYQAAREGVPEIARGEISLAHQTGLSLDVSAEFNGIM